MDQRSISTNVITGGLGGGAPQIFFAYGRVFFRDAIIPSPICSLFFFLRLFCFRSTSKKFRRKIDVLKNAFKFQNSLFIFSEKVIKFFECAIKGSEILKRKNVANSYMLLFP